MVKTRSAIRTHSSPSRDDDPVERAVQTPIAEISVSDTTDTAHTQNRAGSHITMALASIEPASGVFQRILDHVKTALNNVAEIQPAQFLYEREVAEIQLRLRQLFGSLHEQHPDNISTIEDDIVRYAGRLQMMEMNGLRDAEMVQEGQVAAVFQAFTDVVLTELPPRFLQASLQKIVSGELQPNFDALQVMPLSAYAAGRDWISNQGQDFGHAAESDPKRAIGGRLENGSQSLRKCLGPLEKGNSTPRDASYDQHGEQKRKRAKLDTTTTACGQQPGNELRSRQARPIVLQTDDAQATTSSPSDELHDNRATVALEIVDARKSRHKLTLRSRGIERVDRILARQATRPIQLTQGVMFSPEGISAMRDDEIISAMIQASGNVMQDPCTHCRHGNRAPFDECIMIIDDETVKRCGNCEWIDGGCHGASAAALVNQPADLERKNDDPGTDVWGIHQIKTHKITSAESCEQFWRWSAEERELKYATTAPTQHLVDFDVKLIDIATVRASVDSHRARIVMKDQSSVIRQHDTPRADVMVVFEERTTVGQFLQFCRSHSIPVSEEAGPVLVTEWRNMSSEVLQ